MGLAAGEEVRFRSGLEISVLGVEGESVTDLGVEESGEACEGRISDGFEGETIDAGGKFDFFGAGDIGTVERAIKSQ